jgi:hypothetical protein
MDPTSPSLSLRPTDEEKRQNLLKDLEKPGYVVITHTGEIISRPVDPQVDEAKDAGSLRS